MVSKLAHFVIDRKEQEKGYARLWDHCQQFGIESKHIIELECALHSQSLHILAKGLKHNPVTAEVDNYSIMLSDLLKVYPQPSNLPMYDVYRMNSQHANVHVYNLASNRTESKLLE